MIFNSIDFGVFFIVVFLLNAFVFNKNLKYRNIFLLVVSYFFYGWWDWRFLGLIFFSSILDFFLGKKIDEEQNPINRKWLLGLSLGINLGLLGFFKYAGFFVESFTTAFTFLGFPIESHTINIILPVGISFYTFQTLSYTWDIYKRQLKPNHDVLRFLAFVSFFPQLVAGPIERASHLLPQFDSIKKINYKQLRSGFLLMAVGFFKKIVIADRLARFVDPAFADYDQLAGYSAIIAILFFTLQLYFDFSAYSNIAIGCGRMLGFELSLNFNKPYLSTSFSDFWRRWHISLSSWFKDYVYIPLGGNKSGKFFTIRNFLIVFLLSGLWHGASWNFVLWGLFNGLFLIILDPFVNKFNKFTLGKLAAGIIVFSCWALSLVLFRTSNFEQAKIIYSHIFIISSKSIDSYGLSIKELNFTFTILIFYFILEWIELNFSSLSDWLFKRNLLFRWAVYILIILSIIILGSYGSEMNDKQFIYFQF
jgi:D-alanyl-lipoteichoic acid acyltransferase DltB (MBOAT superfamily)